MESRLRSTLSLDRFSAFGSFLSREMSYRWRQTLSSVPLELIEYNCDLDQFLYSRTAGDVDNQNRPDACRRCLVLNDPLRSCSGIKTPSSLIFHSSRLCSASFARHPCSASRDGQRFRSSVRLKGSRCRQFVLNAMMWVYCAFPSHRAGRLRCGREIDRGPLDELKFKDSLCRVRIWVIVES